MDIYFSGNGDLIFAGMNQNVQSGDRILAWQDNSWTESYATIPVSGYHPYQIRLPDQFQSSLQKITCPTCHLTYTHQHVFVPGVSAPTPFTPGVSAPQSQMQVVGS
jgi:hypothetical protein